MTQTVPITAGHAAVPGCAFEAIPTQAAHGDTDSQLAICVPTYRRPHLLSLLLDDLMNQTCRPGCLIVVDGDPESSTESSPESSEVRKVIDRFNVRCVQPIVYVPSAHANLPFQRYLGWLAAQGAEYLLYLDDDLRIRQRSAIAGLVRPLRSDASVAGVTAQMCYPDRGTDRASYSWTNWAARRFGSGKRTRPGGLTPTGYRRLPDASGRDYDEVEWLRGGAMAFRMSALSEESFGDDLFALHRIGVGLGEDTVLARRVRPRGRLLLARHVELEHPDSDITRAYPTDAFRYGYAWAYSRRMINDSYRGFAPPRLSDRLELLRTYAGNAAWYAASMLTRPSRSRCLPALGYLSGACAGIVAKPASCRLTPDIDWRADAQRSLLAAITVA